MSVINPKVSIILPNFNFGHLISETLDSVLSQSLQDWECIIIDDGSTDNSFGIIKSYLTDKRFKYIYQRNKGLAGARNTGLRNASGKYIQYLDSDDKLEPFKLELHSKFLDENPDVGIVYGLAKYFYSEAPDLLYGKRNGDVCWGDDSWMLGISGKGKDIYLTLAKNNLMAVNCAMFRKTVIDVVGYNDEKLYNRQDYDFWLRCAENGISFSFQNLYGTLALVRTHKESMSTNRKKVLQYVVMLYNKHMNRTKIPAARKIFKKRLGKNLGLIAVEDLNEKNYYEGVKGFLKAFRFTANPRWILNMVIGLISPRALSKSINSSTSSLIKRGFKFEETI